MRDNRSCSTCKFSEMGTIDAEKELTRYCRRHPPSVHPIIVMTPQGPREMGSWTGHPQCQKNGWCYEWQADLTKGISAVLRGKDATADSSAIATDGGSHTEGVPALLLKPSGPKGQ